MRHLFAVSLFVLVVACGGGGGGSGGGNTTTAPSPAPSQPADPPPTTSPDPTTDPIPEQFNIGGSLNGADYLEEDFDTNDPNTGGDFNNSPLTSQDLGSMPIQVNGFVTATPTGIAGSNFENTTDPEDYFELSVTESAEIVLEISDFESSSPTAVDLDLEVYDGLGNLLYASQQVDSQTEAVSIPAGSNYEVLVRAVSGQSLYILSIQPTATITVSAARSQIRVESVMPEQVSMRTDDNSFTSASTAITPLAPKLARLELDTFDLSTKRDFGKHFRDALTDQNQARQEDTLRAMKELNQRAGEDVFEPVSRVRRAGVDTDVDFIDQWGLADIDWPLAQQLLEGYSLPGDPIIAVIDDGFLVDHPDIAPVLFDQRDFVPSSVDGDGYDASAADDAIPSDDGEFCHTFHGSRVASIATAPVNGTAMAGVFPGAKLMALKIGYNRTPECEFLSGDLVNAIRYAAGLQNISGALPPRRADVINLSLSTDMPYAALEDAINAATAEGVVVVASSGNSSPDRSDTEPVYPAAYDNVISVNALDSYGSVAFYSLNYPQIDLLAPGGDLSLDVDDDGRPDGILGAAARLAGDVFELGFGFSQGTSFSSPHVAGAIGLLMAINPDLTPADIRNLLDAGALTDPTPTLNQRTGQGTLSLAKLVQAGLGSAPLSMPITYGHTYPERMPFGFGVSSASFDLLKSGPDSLTVANVEVQDATWDSDNGSIEVNAVNLDTDGFGEYRVSLNRGFIPTGLHTAEVVFTFDDGSKAALQLSLSRLTLNSGQGETSPIYIQALRDDGTGTFVLEGVTLEAGGAESFWGINNLDAGTYRLVYGTDTDFDGELCDPGELCGYYPAVDQTFELDRDRELISLILQ